MPRIRTAAASIPIERFFTRADKPDALIRELKAKEKAAGRDPRLLEVAVGNTRVPLAKLEKDLDAMWKDRFDPGPLGRGELFRPRFEKDFLDPATLKLSHKSAKRLGRLSDEAVGQIRFTEPSRLAHLLPARTDPGLIQFLARSCELNTPNATWATAALRAFFQQPLALVDLQVGGATDAELAKAWLRAATAIDLDANQLGVQVPGMRDLVPLRALEKVLDKRAYADALARRPGLVHEQGLPWDVPGSPDAGPMVFDYGTAPGYGGGTAGYFPEPPTVRPPAPPRLVPAPPDVRVPARPPSVRPVPSTGGVVFTPPPPPPPPPVGRPLRSTSWEIIATPGASDFFQAKARGYDGSWEDWKTR